MEICQISVRKHDLTHFCVNGFSIKWKFDQEFTTLSFKNGIPFYRECTVLLQGSCKDVNRAFELKQWPRSRRSKPCNDCAEMIVQSARFGCENDKSISIT